MKNQYYDSSNKLFGHTKNNIAVREIIPTGLKISTRKNNIVYDNTWSTGVE